MGEAAENMNQGDQNQGTDQGDSMGQQDELTVLKARAAMMGIQHSNNIGIDTLRQKIQDKLEGKVEESVAPPAPGTPPAPAQPNALETGAENLNKSMMGGATAAGVPTNRPIDKLDAPQPKTLREQLWEENMRLVRCRITNMDPKKKDLPGEIFAVGNEYLGMVRKFVPFGEHTDEGYHIPFIIYQMLESRRFLNIRTVRDRRTGTDKVSSNYAKEFAIEVLDPLTPEELKTLAQAQIAAGSLDSPNG